MTRGNLGFSSDGCLRACVLVMLVLDMEGLLDLVAKKR